MAVVAAIGTLGLFVPTPIDYPSPNPLYILQTVKSEYFSYFGDFALWTESQLPVRFSEMKLRLTHVIFPKRCVQELECGEAVMYACCVQPPRAANLAQARGSFHKRPGCASFPSVRGDVRLHKCLGVGCVPPRRPLSAAINRSMSSSLV